MSDDLSFRVSGYTYFLAIFNLPLEDPIVESLGSPVFLGLAPGRGRDIIFNFEDGTDKIGLGGGLSFSDLEIVGSGSSTRIKILDAGKTLATLRKIDDALIGADDFV